MVGSTDYKARESEKLRSVGRGVSFRDRRIVKERCRKEILWEELARSCTLGAVNLRSLKEGRTVSQGIRHGAYHLLTVDTADINRSKCQKERVLVRGELRLQRVTVMARDGSSNGGSSGYNVTALAL